MEVKKLFVGVGGGGVGWVRFLSAPVHMSGGSLVTAQVLLPVHYVILAHPSLTSPQTITYIYMLLHIYTDPWCGPTAGN